MKLLRKWLGACEVTVEDGLACRILGAASEDVVRLLRLILVQYKIVDGKIQIEGEDAAALAFCLGYGNSKNVDVLQAASVVEAVSLLSGVLVKDKAPTYVGGRMGRPEKAKKRDMRPAVHVLFPVGLKGGTHRDLLEAAKQGPVFVEMVKRKCPNCKNYSSKVKCAICGVETVVENFCPRCGRTLKEGAGCPTCHTEAVQYQRQPVNFRDLVGESCNSLGYQAPKILKRRQRLN